MRGARHRDICYVSDTTPTEAFPPLEKCRQFTQYSCCNWLEDSIVLDPFERSFPEKCYTDKNGDDDIYIDLQRYVPCFACSGLTQNWTIYPEPTDKYWTKMRFLMDIQYDRFRINRTIENDFITGANMNGYQKWSGTFLARLWRPKWTRVGKQSTAEMID